MDHGEVRRLLRAWILTHSKSAAPPSEFTDETPILETGLLSSLDVVELILYVESLTGVEVDIESLEPQALENMNSLFAYFLRE